MEQNDRIKNILVIKFCCLGDLVFITPALLALRHAYPGAKITLLVSHWIEELAACLPMIDSVLVSDAPYEKSLSKKIISTLRLVFTLRKLHPDIVLTTHRKSIFGFLALLSGSRCRVGFSETKYLTHTAPFVSSQHEVDRYYSLLSSIGITHEGTRTFLQAPQRDEETANSKLQELGVPPDESVILIFPGGGENVGTSMTIKRWHPERFVELLNLIRKKSSLKIFLIGSAGERILCDQIASRVPGTINIAGTMGLREIVALGKRCRLFIGSDSGPTHMVAAAGAPTITIFGPSDPRLVAPRGENQEYIWKQPPCAPCYTPLTVLEKKNYRGKTFLCHTGTHECIQTVTVGDVWPVVKKIMNIS